MSTPVVNKTKITIPPDTVVYLFYGTKLIMSTPCTKPGIYTMTGTAYGPVGTDEYYFCTLSSPLSYTGVVYDMAYDTWMVAKKDVARVKYGTSIN